MSMFATIAGIVLGGLLSVVPQDPKPGDPKPGIDAELAAARRARVSDVHYDLAFVLDRGMTSVAGTAALRFTLGADARERPLILDFAGEALTDVVVNGTTDVALPRVGNHVVVPGDLLRQGTNTFTARMRSRVAATGTPLSHDRDDASGEDFYYTLLVPADAHGLFPCFDQPDLKARFALSIEAPADWHVVANTDGTSRDVDGDRRRHDFPPSELLPTYLFAFAAGPFAVVEAPASADARRSGISRGIRLFVRRSRLKHVDAETLVALHERSLAALADEFATPYPFGKLDAVLLQGFPYRGMEHAGAIFYRESSLVFDHAPTVDERVRRSVLVYHEVTHQWFGNLVTMAWFDDLWLKEGFATFYGYRMLDRLEPESDAWLRFLQHVKPAAYQVDVTPGTTPIWQSLANLADAKSAYGPIVYNKAPAVLRELCARLGDERFRDGVRAFLKRHRFGNAKWTDLVRALEASSSTDMAAWSARWILDPGMPRVTARHDADANAIVVEQRAVDGSDRVWPLRLDLLVVDEDGTTATLHVDLDGARAILPRATRPAALLLNPRDVCYGQFVPDAASTQWLVTSLGALTDPLARSVALASLFEAVREAELDPRVFAGLAIDRLAVETDAESRRWLTSAFATCTRRWMSEASGTPFVERLATLLHATMDAQSPSARVDAFRFLARHATDDATLRLCEAVLATDGTPPHELALGARDRFLAATALMAAGRGRDAFDRLAATDDPETTRLAYIHGAAERSVDAKAQWFASYREAGEPPEQWMAESLPFFHFPGQSALTLPYLRDALDLALWVKANRRIFFLPTWLDAFVNGHASAEALEIVETFRRDAALPDDVDRKLLQALDGLRRAVRIRAKFG